MNFILKKTINRRWPLCCLLFLLLACHKKSPYASVKADGIDSVKTEQETIAALDVIYLDKKLVKQGDLIMRTGRDFTSETMRRLSEHDKTYSHCGIASIENDSVFVYHSIGGEWNPNQRLRRDAFEIFCNPFENRGFGIFRYKLSPQDIAHLISVVHKLYTAGVMFDMQFDLTSDERMYCTEFVYKAVEEASRHKISLSTTTFHDIKFVTTDNLFINPDCTEIKRVKFNR